MRRTPILMLAAVFALACADTPSSPMLEPAVPSFDRAPVPDYPPPPYAIITGDVSTEHEAATYTANFFVNKPGNVAWLMFTGGTGVTFSQGARIMSVNGNVSGFGTMTIGGSTYKLNTVSDFDFNGNCTSTVRGSCASFEGEGFQSFGSAWTGQIAGRPIFKPGGKPGDGGGGEVCIPDATGECGFIKTP